MQTVEFELDMTGLHVPRNYIWNLSPLRTSFRTDISLLAVIGRDVSEFKRMTGLKARMEVELKTAKAVQGHADAVALQADLGRIRIAGSYQPCTECGGDWWFYREYPGRIALGIGDVTGHGASAALLTSATRSLLSYDGLMARNSASVVAASINECIYDLAKSASWMTAIFGFFDLDTSVFT